jgi:cytochrome c oxidase assembly protein Cox11
MFLTLHLSFMVDNPIIKDIREASLTISYPFFKEKKRKKEKKGLLMI